MGLFDFLKVDVLDKKAKRGKAAGKAAASGSVVRVDNKTFPLLMLTPKGFVAGNFDGSLIKGQKAHIVLVVDDDIGRFSLQSAVLVTEAQGDKFAGEFNLITPEMENTLRQYQQRRKQKGG